jgi:hypothetical protein
MTRFGSLILAVSFLVSGCDGSTSTLPASSATAVKAVTRARLETEPTACTPTGAHAQHATLGVPCSACHGAGGKYVFAPITLGGGMTTEGGTMQQTDTTTNCTVACHGTAPIAWNHGPISCTGCHAGIVVAGAMSSHVANAEDPVAGRAECQGCHLMDSHGSGTVVLATADGTRVAGPGQPEVEAFCASCHDGAGKLIGDRAPPPILAFWTTAGDPHGVAGTTASLGCTTCHSAHSSTQAWLIAPVIDGTPTTMTTMAPNGVGAEGTCVTCHSTLPRHSASGCLVECHSPHGTGALVGHSVTGAPVPDDYSCFYCHGHSAIKQIRLPNTCNHCHSNSSWWISGRATEAVAPIFTLGPSVTAGTTTATVAWSTSEASDHWVAAAVGTNVTWTGAATKAVSHSVALTGLVVGTSYRLSARSADFFLNTSTSQWFTYTAGGPGVPRLTDEPNVSTGGTSLTVQLVWAAVTNPGALPITYVVEVDDGPAFDSVVATASVTGTNTTFVLPSGATYWWRVRARDSRPYEAISVVDTFTVTKL